MLDLWCGGTSAAYMGHAIPSAGMGCTGGKTTYGSLGETHTLLLERPGGGEAIASTGKVGGNPRALWRKREQDTNPQAIRQFG